MWQWYSQWLPDVVADDEGRELVQHGSALFPIACYEEDLKSYSVAWHWHEEFEYILAVKGPLAVDVSKARLVLQTGQGVFVNSGVFHAVEQAETGDALLHSGVFHPRLIGGMDTIFLQKSSCRKLRRQALSLRATQSEMRSTFSSSA